MSELRATRMSHEYTYNLEFCKPSSNLPIDLIE